MSKKYDIIERRHVLTNCPEEVSLVIKRGDNVLRKSHEYEKKIKREIANCNERRRMKSINLGFEMLKQLLPGSIDGEKLSKASILQLTAQYIDTLHSRITKLETDILNLKDSSKEPSNISENSKHLPNPDLCNQNTKELFNSTYSVASETDCSDNINKKLSDKNNVENENHKNNTESICRKRRYYTCQNSINSNTQYLMKSEDNITNKLNIDDEDDMKIIYCDDSSDTNETPGSLEHLVAAIQQVEGEQFYPDGKIKCHVVTKSINNQLMVVNKTDKLNSHVNNSSKEITSSNSDNVNKIKYLLKPSVKTTQNPVIKPTISPYTEKILFDYSQNPHIFKSTKLVNADNVRKISIPPKYHHRPDVVLQKHTINSTDLL